MAMPLQAPRDKKVIVEATTAIGAVGIILMLVLPLPEWILDSFLALNITVALGVLMMTFYIEKPLEFSSFPSMLLLVTLFRLSLNVSATRLILGTGQAGSVIAAFGTFVIGGNYLVGIVVFLILVVIQFVVITSGAGRVAEVAARFTLDAMPGKQMAIDAELNSGAIDEATARARRSEVAREADFYGAMDGASKFVRGDAIAAVVMIVVNIIGGLVVGILQRGMDITAALQSYTILTVGEGIVTQIPALLISASSGLLVTRTAGQTTLGAELGQQVLAKPQALYIVAGALAMMSLAPGLPKPAFLIIAAGVALGAFTLQKQRRTAAASVPLAPTATKQPETMTDLLAVDPLEVELGYGLVCLADAKQGGDLLDRVTASRRQLASELGLVIPPIRVRDNVKLRGSQYVIRLRGQEIASGELFVGQFLALEGGEGAQPLPGTPAVDPAFGVPAVWIAASQRAVAEVSGYTVVEPVSVLTTHLTELLRRFAPELLGRQDTQSLLDNVKKSAPALIEELVPNLMTVGHIQRVLQLLLRDRISIRDLVSILEALADAAPSVRDPETLVDHVRSRMARQLTQQYAENDGRLYCMTLHPAAEQNLLERVRLGDGVLAVAPDEQRRMVDAFKLQAENMVRFGHRPLLLCPPRLRAQVRSLTEIGIPTLVVLSYAEIAQNVPVESLGMVNWNDENSTI